MPILSVSPKLKLAITSFALAVCFTGCASPGNEKKPIPEQSDRSSFSQLGKTDFDRMADVEMRENTESLRTLMIKLYKRNPQELKKSTSDNMDRMVEWVFEGGHHWKFPAIQNKQDTDAIFLAFKPEYQGDRVLPFIVGLQTMLIKAHGNKTEFFLMDQLDPQKIYNAARNVEIAAWKLSNARDANGRLYLLTNEMNETERNLSFEREFGKIVGRTDLYAIALAEKSQRFITRVVQNLATAVFLPF
ncbi:hypothetical protein MTYP_00239 [Methylophilaceae bacterium]|nr:hypothetical protein MTYP_00239 [Methylophilaceae bacterium]